jgi:hypothetical protein
MNNKQLAMLDDISRRLSEQGTKNKSEPKGDDFLHNPAQIEISNSKKNVSGLQSSKNMAKVKNDNRSTELFVIKSSRGEEKDASIDNKVEKKEQEENKKVKEQEVTKEAKDSIANPNPQENSKETKSILDINCLKLIEKFLDSSPVVILMTILTIFAMFASDIQIAYLIPEYDYNFDIIDCLLFCIFTIEICLASISKKNYVGSFFFWLDVISTLSLLQDISFILENLLTGYDSLHLQPAFIETASTNVTLALKGKNSSQATSSLSKLSSAARATRVLRIIRIVRLIRIVKLYKSALIARANIEKRKKEKEKQKKNKESMETATNSLESSRSMIRNENQNIEQLEAVENMSPEIKMITETEPILPTNNNNNNKVTKDKEVTRKTSNKNIKGIEKYLFFRWQEKRKG